jgi:hypothetical protein
MRSLEVKAQICRKQCVVVADDYADRHHMMDAFSRRSEPDSSDLGSAVCFTSNLEAKMQANSPKDT